MVVARIESLVMGSHPVTPPYVVCTMARYVRACRVPRPPTAVLYVERGERSPRPPETDGQRQATEMALLDRIRYTERTGGESKASEPESGVPPAKIVLETLRKKFQEKICM
jgi:hypothetical protein